VSGEALSVFCILGGWCWLFWRTFGPLFTPGPSEYVPDQARADPLEAHRWLTHHPTDAPLAPVRFAGNGEALRFVDSLYTLGALHIRVIPPQALLIYLPRNRSARRRLFSRAAAETTRQGLPPEEDAGQPWLRIIWYD